MAKSARERFDDTILYLISYIEAGLAVKASTALLGREDEVGAALSLSRSNGTKAQRRANRALLMCQYAFLEPPHAVDQDDNGYNYHGDPELGKTHYRDQTEIQIQDAIRAYLPVAGAAVADLVTAADAVKGGSPHGPAWEVFTRASDPFPRMRVCFDALRLWLFKAGFVSLHWLTKSGPTMTAQTANNILGQGQVVAAGMEHTIPAGWLFNIHKEGDQSVCHWGISLGGGWAAGCNTQPDWPGSPAPVQFRNGGDMHYGEFLLSSSVEVCRYKYSTVAGAPTNVVLRQIDPSAVQTYT